MLSIFSLTSNKNNDKPKTSEKYGPDGINNLFNIVSLLNSLSDIFFYVNYILARMNKAEELKHFRM